MPGQPQQDPTLAVFEALRRWCRRYYPDYWPEDVRVRLRSGKVIRKAVLPIPLVPPPDRPEPEKP